MKFLVHLHADVFYDVEVEAESDDEAFDLARDLVYRHPENYVDHKSSYQVEASEAEDWIEAI